MRDCVGCGREYKCVEARTLETGLLLPRAGSLSSSLLPSNSHVRASAAPAPLHRYSALQSEYHYTKNRSLLVRAMAEEAGDGVW